MDASAVNHPAHSHAKLHFSRRCSAAGETTIAAKRMEGAMMTRAKARNQPVSTAHRQRCHEDPKEKQRIQGVLGSNTDHCGEDIQRGLSGQGRRRRTGSPSSQATKVSMPARKPILRGDPIEGKILSDGLWKLTGKWTPG